MAAARKARKGKTSGKTALEAAEAAEAPADIPEAACLTARDREQVAVCVLDLTLLELQRRLRENPSAMQASGIAEVTKLLALFWRFKDKLDNGEQDQAGLRALVDSLPTYADDDDDDPLLKQGDGHQQQLNISPADITALAHFED